MDVTECSCGVKMDNHHHDEFCSKCGDKIIVREPKMIGVKVYMEEGLDGWGHHITFKNLKKLLDEI